MLPAVVSCLHYNLGSWQKPRQWLNRQTALERQDLSRTYLAHHELESVVIIIIVINGSTVTQPWGAGWYMVCYRTPTMSSSFSRL